MFDTLKVYLQKTLPFTDSEIQLADKYFETVFVARRDFLLTGGQISTSQKRDRQQAIAYLDVAIALDPNGKAGRRKAEVLRMKLLKMGNQIPAPSP